MRTFVIPSDYYVALIDLMSYPSFVASDWTSLISSHFISQMNRGTMIAWGTGAPGNWRLEIATERGQIEGYREFDAFISVNGDRLHLTNYDELTMAAQFSSYRLPHPETAEWHFPVDSGDYNVRVIQLYNPDLAYSFEVFEQLTPHFRVELTKSPGQQSNQIQRVPWFEELR